MCVAIIHACPSEVKGINMVVYIYIYIGMLLQKRTDTSAVGIYKLYEENTH